MDTIDQQDLAEAVKLLEAEPDVHCWDLSRITNSQHAVDPRGKGLSVTVVHSLEPMVTSLSQTMRPSPSLLRVWEKAGRNRTIVNATKVAIGRLKHQIEQRKNAQSQEDK